MSLLCTYLQKKHHALVRPDMPNTWQTHAIYTVMLIHVIPTKHTDWGYKVIQSPKHNKGIAFLSCLRLFSLWNSILRTYNILQWFDRSGVHYDECLYIMMYVCTLWRMFVYLLNRLSLLLFNLLNATFQRWYPWYRGIFVLG